MTSRKLAHKVQNLLQVIMGHIDLAETVLTGKLEIVKAHLSKAKNAVQEVSRVIQRSVGKKKNDL